MYNKLFVPLQHSTEVVYFIDYYAGILLHYHLHIEPTDAIVSVIKIAIYNG